MYVYRFLNINKEIIYVGRTNNIKKRINNHSHLPDICYSEIDSIEYIKLNNNDESAIYERYYINKFSPKYNTLINNNSNFSFVLPEKEWNILNNSYIEHINKQETTQLIENIYIADIKDIPSFNSLDIGNKISIKFNKYLFDKEISPTTYYYFNKLIIYHCSDTYTLKHKNNELLSKDVDIAEILGIKHRAWGYIKADLIKYNLIKTIKLNGIKLYKVNPCSINMYDKITIDTYYAFKEDIINNNLLSISDILFLDKILLGKI